MKNYKILLTTSLLTTALLGTQVASLVGETSVSPIFADKEAKSKNYRAAVDMNGQEIIDIGLNNNATTVAYRNIMGQAELVTFGSNTHQSLGNGDSNESTTVSKNNAVKVDIDTELTEVKFIESNYNNTYVVFTNDDETKSEVWGWGDNSYGQIPNATGVSTQPVLVASYDDGTIVEGIATSFASTTFVTSKDGSITVHNSGDNSVGQLSSGDKTVTGTFIDVDASYNSVSLAYNDGSADKVYSWGDNSNGQTGTGTDLATGIVTDYTEVTGLGSEVEGVYAGKYDMYFVSDNKVYGAGAALEGQLGGSATNASEISPILIGDGTIASDVFWVSAGDDWAMAFADNGTSVERYVWGSTANGQLGNNDESETTIDVTKQEDLNYDGTAINKDTFIAADSNEHATAKVLNDTTSGYYALEGFGLNDIGLFGDSSVTDAVKPTSIYDVKNDVDVNDSTIKLDESSITTDSYEFTLKINNTMINDSFNLSFKSDEGVVTPKVVSIDKDGTMAFIVDGQTPGSTVNNLKFSIDGGKTWSTNVIESITFNKLAAQDPTIKTTEFDTSKTTQTAAVFNYELTVPSDSQHEETTLDKVVLSSKKAGVNKVMDSPLEKGTIDVDSLTAGTTYDDFEFDVYANGKTTAVATKTGLSVKTKDKIANTGIENESITVEGVDGDGKLASNNSATIDFSFSTPVETETTFAATDFTFKQIKSNTEILKTDGNPVEITKSTKDGYDNWSGKVTVVNLTPETKYSNISISVKYNNGTKDTSDNINDTSLSFTTGDYDKISEPTAEITVGETNITSITINYSINVPKNTDTQRPTQVDTATLYYSGMGEENHIDLIKKDGVNGLTSWTGSYKFENLEGGTEYTFHLSLGYSAFGVDGNDNQANTNDADLNATTLDKNNAVAPTFDSLKTTVTPTTATFTYGFTIPEGGNDTEPTKIESLDVYFGENAVSASPLEEGTDYKITNPKGDYSTGIIEFTGLTIETTYFIKVVANGNWDSSTEIFQTANVTTKQLNPASEPKINKAELSATSYDIENHSLATLDYEVTIPNYNHVDDPDASYANVHSISMGTSTEADLYGSVNVENQQTGGVISGTIQLVNMDYETTYNDLVMTVNWSDRGDESGEPKTETKDDFDEFKTDSYSQPKVTVSYAHVLDGDVSQTSAAITYRIFVPPINIGELKPIFKEVELVKNGDDTVIDSSTDNQGKLVVDGLTQKTTYNEGDYQLNVKYDLVYPDYDSRAGDVHDSLSEKFDVSEFTTLDEPPQVVGDLVYQSYDANKKELHTSLSMYDDKGWFDINKTVVRAKVNGSEDYTEFTVKADKVSSAPTHDDSKGATVVEYNLTIQGVEPGKTYSGWQISLDDGASFKDVVLFNNDTGYPMNNFTTSDLVNSKSQKLWKILALISLITMLISLIAMIIKIYMRG